MSLQIKAWAVIALVILLQTGQRSFADAQKTMAERFADSIMEQWPKLNYNNKGWEYNNGIILHGIGEVYIKTGDQKYLDYIKSFVDSFLQPDGSLPDSVYSSYSMDPQTRTNGGRSGELQLLRHF